MPTACIRPLPQGWNLSCLLHPRLPCVAGALSHTDSLLGAPYRILPGPRPRLLGLVRTLKRMLLLFLYDLASKDQIFDAPLSPHDCPASSSPGTTHRGQLACNPSLM